MPRRPASHGDGCACVYKGEAGADPAARHHRHRRIARERHGRAEPARQPDAHTRRRRPVLRDPGRRQVRARLTRAGTASTAARRRFRLTGRGYCTQPARAVGGERRCPGLPVRRRGLVDYPGVPDRMSSSAAPGAAPASCCLDHARAARGPRRCRGRGRQHRAADRRFRASESPSKPRSARRHLFEAWRAESTAARAQGLMFVEDCQMRPDQAMIFVYDPPEPVAMWMKNTLLPLDMLFVDERGCIVTITDRRAAAVARDDRIAGPRDAGGRAQGRHRRRARGIGRRRSGVRLDAGLAAVRVELARPRLDADRSGKPPIWCNLPAPCSAIAGATTS